MIVRGYVQEAILLYDSKKLLVKFRSKVKYPKKLEKKLLIKI